MIYSYLKVGDRVEAVCSLARPCMKSVGPCSTNL